MASWLAQAATTWPLWSTMPRIDKHKDALEPAESMDGWRLSNVDGWRALLLDAWLARQDIGVIGAGSLPARVGNCGAGC